MLDFVKSLDTLTKEQQAHIFDLTLQGSQTHLQLYLEKRTDLDIDTIETIIILFYKVHKGIDKDFKSK